MVTSSTQEAKGCVGVVDDDPRTARLVKAWLEKDGYQVAMASDGAEALKLVEASDLELLVLDVMLPGMDGCEVVRRVREFSSLPIILMTGQKKNEVDIVRGLESGGDDYVVKPLSERQLVARVHAVIRRSRFGPDERRPALFSNRDLLIDYAQHLVTLRSKEIPLTPTEYRLVALLAQNAGRTLLQEDILLQVWGPGYEGEAHLLRVNVARLRAKLGEDADTAQYILTRPGAGYLMPALGEA